MHDRARFFAFYPQNGVYRPSLGFFECIGKVILSFWVSVTRHAQSTQNKFVCLFNISIKAWMMKLIFDLQKMTASLGVHVGRQAQTTKNNQFTISLHYLKENIKDEVDFLPAD